MIFSGEDVALCEVVHLCLRQLAFVLSHEDASCPDVVPIVEQLRRVALDRAVRVDAHHLVTGLLLQARVIVIDGRDDAKLRQGIGIPSLLMLIERKGLVLDAGETSLGLRAVDIKVFVARLFLTELHLLHVRDKLFYLVVGEVIDRVEILLRPAIVHGRGLHEREIVERLGPACGIILGEAQRAVRIDACGVEVAIVEIVRLFVETVHNGFVALRTSSEEQRDKNDYGGV